MDNDTVIKVDNIHKKFCLNLKRSIFYGTLDVFRNMFGISYDLTKLRKSEFWALQNVTLELKQGESLGILGPNGSGKTTLLRLITGIFPPEKGTITIRGRVGSLIAVGAGFHPHMTGRENIYLNGTILGMRKAEIRKKFDEIVDFADIGDFLEAPVSAYSSGMSIRLGFAIAIHSNPDIILMDEILAVGDVSFQKKCFEKIWQLKKEGISSILVSHSIGALEQMCERGLLIDNGKQVFAGSLGECVKKYMELLYQKNIQKELLKLSTDVTRQVVGTGNVTFSNVYVYQEGRDRNIPEIEFGENIIIEFDYEIKEKHDNDYRLAMEFRTLEGQYLIQNITFDECPYTDGASYDNHKFVAFKKKSHAKVEIIGPRLFPQVIRLNMAFNKKKFGVHEGGISNAAIFSIIEPTNKKFFFEYGNQGMTEFDHSIELY
jgi:lipopolysaccharide transport system ATP-binding protein